MPRPPCPVPTARVLYTDILLLATQNEALGDIPNAAILVEGNTIAWVGPASALPPAAAAADATVSMEGCCVIPGLVNTHHHMYQTLTRCIAQVSQPPDLPRRSKNPPARRRAACPSPRSLWRALWPLAYSRPPPPINSSLILLFHP